MTKRELLYALAEFADDAKVYVALTDRDYMVAVVEVEPMDDDDDGPSAAVLHVGL